MQAEVAPVVAEHLADGEEAVEVDLLRRNTTSSLLCRSVTASWPNTNAWPAGAHQP